MTIGHAITLIEIDVPAYRATQFELVQEYSTVPNWTLGSGTVQASIGGVVDLDFPSTRGLRWEHGTGGSNSIITWDLPPSLRDVSALALLKPTSAGIVPGIWLRASAGAPMSGYLCRLDGTRVVLSKATAGTIVEVAELDFAVATNDLVWMKFDSANQTDGVLIRAKVWIGAPEEEPREFMLSYEDTVSPISTAGEIGLYSPSTANTAFTCGFFRVHALLNSVTDTLRFAKATDALPVTFDAIPSIKDVKVSAATISLGKDLGKRASVTATFIDHPWAESGEFYDSGTFWGRFRTRKLFRRGNSFRILRGYEGQELAEFTTYYYLLDKFDGPTLKDGTFQITAQDILKFADDDRAKAPILNNAMIATSLDTVQTIVVLSPASIGDAELPTSGLACIGGKEIVSFTRSGESVTAVRGQQNTVAIAHDSGERFQLVLQYDGDDVADIISDLLINYAGVDSSYIPLAEWQAETAENLNVIYARTITEPTSVKKLLSELIEQAALALWWDERAQLIRLKVLVPIATDADTIDESMILIGTLDTKEQFDKRKSQIWISYNQRNPTDRGDNEDNYRQGLATVDLESEDEYGSQEIESVKASWIQTDTAAERHNILKISRFRDPPRNFKFQLHPGTPIIAGAGYRLKWIENQTEYGQTQDVGAPIQITRVAVSDGVIEVEAEEMLASGEVILSNTVVLTTTGALLAWTLPDTWNNLDNDVHCIGGGGGGARGQGSNNGAGGQGGGGGAYSSSTNVTFAGPTVQYRVGDGGIGETASNGASTSGSDTWIGGSTLAASTVGAKAGTRGFGQNNLGQGGQASSGVGATKFSGGNGGAGRPGGGENQGGGGGGAAAGPNGDGGDGGDAPGEPGGGGGGANGGEDASDSNSIGGSNRFGFGGGTSGSVNGVEGGGGAGGTNDNNPGPGSQEGVWTQTIAPIISVGPGSGGGGGADQQSASLGRGSLYGGGGGGSGRSKNVPSSTGGDGAQGIIVIRWRNAS